MGAAVLGEFAPGAFGAVGGADVGPCGGWVGVGVGVEVGGWGCGADE